LFELHPLNLNSFTLKHLQITPILLHHHNLPVLGFRIGDFAYLTDFNRIDSEELLKLKGCKTLVVDALRQQEHISHNSLQQALNVIRAVEPNQSYLIHMSHDMGLYTDTECNLPEGVHFSYDGLILNL
jgi:phosphoribosyl 1,2-cyclic phosphate phosphodiesterase